MLLVRFQTKEKKTPLYGIWAENHVTVIVSSPFEGMIVGTSEKYDVNDIVILPPCEPTKIVAVGLNCKNHAAEINMKLPDEPLIFIKPPSSVIGPEDTVKLPKQSSHVEYEAELGIIISERCRNVSEDKVKRYILGYTCANDITARDLQKKDGQWTRAKSFDTFCPLGPFIADNINPCDAKITCHVNGEKRQDFTTATQNFNAFFLVSFISQIMTLEPGDVILTGTSVGVGKLDAGDEVIVNIKGIGELKNKIA